jgi:hypothetical protein
MGCGADTEKEAVAILSQPVYLGFGPTLASDYLAKEHDIAVSRETVDDQGEAVVARETAGGEDS